MMKALLIFFLLPLFLYAQDQSSYLISEIRFQLSQDHPKQISIEELETITVSTLHNQHYSIREINRTQHVLEISKEGLQQLLNDVTNLFAEHGIDWVYANIPSDQIAQDGSDQRQSNQALNVAVSTPTIGKVETSVSDAKGNATPRYQEKQAKIISKNLPSQLPDPATGIPGDFVNSETLNNYLYSLNRHPDKQVDLEIGPADTPGSVALNFIIHQDRPYHFYTSVSSNIPVVVSRWLESVGYINTQLTGRDDILKLDYTTDSFDRLHSFLLSYEAPLGTSVGKRWSLGANVNRFTSGQFGINTKPFRGTQGIVDGEIILNVYQYKRLFLDYYAHLEYRHIRNQAHFIYPEVSKNFLLPSTGLRLTQLKKETKLLASFGVNSTLSDLFWDVGHNLDALGRFDLSRNWAYITFDFYASMFLEAWGEVFLNKKDQATHLANEIVLTANVQNAFNQRLIPQLEGIVGGLYTIRGYPQSTAAGDNLYSGFLEYRFHLPRALKIQPNSKKKLFGKPFKVAPPGPKELPDWDFVLKAFYDIGTVTVNQRQPGEKNEFLMGAGLGAELVLWHNLFIRCDWGISLNAANGIKGGNNEVYFTSVIIF
ncbi:hypothetical protein [Simkania sp.]|uniref:hypothetical protein n=1 Tax=Simkania sp. TaxID=34094 RepID=UPI003B522361